MSLSDDAGANTRQMVAELQAVADQARERADQYRGKASERFTGETVAIELRTIAYALDPLVALVVDALGGGEER